MTETLRPTPGLLLSLCLRYDHSFGIHMGLFERADTLSGKQIRIIESIRDSYISGKIFNDVQLMEELTGTGFYSPERDGYYLGLCADNEVMLKATESTELMEKEYERRAREN